MTKKHYVAIADGFKAQLARIHDLDYQGMKREQIYQSARMICDIAERFNPNFNRERFMAACGF